MVRIPNPLAGGPLLNEPYGGVYHQGTFLIKPGVTVAYKDAVVAEIKREDAGSWVRTNPDLHPDDANPAARAKHWVPKFPSKPRLAAGRWELCRRSTGTAMAFTPKRAPSYIGPKWPERYSDSAHPLITETMGGEPWPQAYARMRFIANVIGWGKHDGLRPGDSIPQTQAELEEFNGGPLSRAKFEHLVWAYPQPAAA